MLNKTIYVLILLCVGVGSYIVGTYYPDNATSDGSIVYAICTYSHNYELVRGAGAWEEACGMAQDVAHMEYLCNQDLDQCWVEEK